MKHFKKIAFGSLLLAVPLFCTETEASILAKGPNNNTTNNGGQKSGPIVELNRGNYASTVNGSRFLIVDVYSVRCGACKQMEPELNVPTGGPSGEEDDLPACVLYQHPLQGYHSDGSVILVRNPIEVRSPKGREPAPRILPREPVRDQIGPCLAPWPSVDCASKPGFGGSPSIAPPAARGVFRHLRKPGGPDRRVCVVACHRFAPGSHRGVEMNFRIPACTWVSTTYPALAITASG